MWHDNSLNRGEISQDEASIWRRVARWVRVRHWCFAREKQRVERLIADHLKQCGCWVVIYEHVSFQEPLLRLWEKQGKSV